MLKGIDKRTFIWCRTEDEAKKVLSLASQENGLIPKALITPENTHWHIYEGKTCYDLLSDACYNVSVCSVDNDLISASHFIEINSKYYPKSKVIHFLHEVMNMGMRLRQDQLNFCSTEKTGKEILDDWIKENL